MLPDPSSKSKADQPIAIIGLGCRFPGPSNSPEEFWELLRTGVDAISEVPPDRWSLPKFHDPDPAEPGKIYARWGGFIEGFDRFDARFFGISPREASRMDPQQRLLLEVAYQALEDAGLQLERLAGSRTGVFVGISTYDYGVLQGQPTEARLIDGYTNLGGALSIAAARLSYAFDLKGPCLSVDTACSSSLVGMHLACQSIWRRESELALVGGVNVLLNPAQTMGFSKASMLSPDGRCKAFDSRANGYVRAEGAGVVILKPLDRALADQDPVYAIVKATAVNQDGRSSSLPVPNRDSQEAMLRDAYRQSGVAPGQVQYVEAHGTGTPVGDPIEAAALGSVLGVGRPSASPCAIGSVKGNIGHLEAGSGVAGIMKAALCLKHREIPPTLHYREPNPEIQFEDLGLRVAAQLEPWPEVGSDPRLAAVNSFGFGGTNAHVVLQEAPPVEKLEAPSQLDEEPVLLSVSARSKEALETLADDYRRHLMDGWASNDVSLASVCRSAGLHRSHHDFRLAIAASSKQDISDHLAAFTAGEERINLSSGRRQTPGESTIAFVFSGMGPQWWAMGRQLLEENPVFRSAIQECDSLLQPLSGWSLLQELLAPEKDSRIQQTRIAQPAIFALQVGLAAVWKSWKIQPAAIVGHSVGEVAAAYVAGALDLKDAVQLIYHRSRLQHKIEGQGRMLAIGMSVESVQGFLNGWEEVVSIAAVNSPETTTLSGEEEALEEINRLVEKQGVFCRFLSVEVPYHSPKMDPIREELVKSLHGLNPRTASCTLISSALGKPVEGHELGSEYWWKNVRDPVLFAQATTELMEAGCNLFLEIGAHPVLTASISDSVTATGEDACTAYSLRRDEPERKTMLANLGKLYTLGHPVDWSLLYPKPDSPLKLPAYPWQRERLWAETEDSLLWRLGRDWHPLLGGPLGTARPTWSVTLNAQSPPYLRDHCVQGAVVYPATAFVEMALSGARRVLGEGPIILQEVNLNKALVLRKAAASELQFALNRQDSSFEISSRANGGDAGWDLNATGNLRLDPDPAQGLSDYLEEIRRRCPIELSAPDFYEKIREVGLEYGPAFRPIERIWVGEQEGLAEIRGLESELSEGYMFHPTQLDACLQVGFCALDVQESLYLPVFLEKFTFYGSPQGKIWCHARIVSQNENSFEVDLQILDESGNQLAKLSRGRCRALGKRDSVRPASSENLHYAYQWVVSNQDEPSTVQPPTFLPQPDKLGQILQERLRARSAVLDRVRHYEEVSPALNGLLAAYALRALEQLGWRRVLGERVSTSLLIKGLKISPEQHILLRELLKLLQYSGVLVESKNDWEIRSLPKTKDPESMWRHLLSKYPAYLAELTLLGRYGARFRKLLQGELDELDALCPQGFRTAVDHFFQDAPSNRIYNDLLGAAVAEGLRALPKGRKAHLLELGLSSEAVVESVTPACRTDQIKHTMISVLEEDDPTNSLPGSAVAPEQRIVNLDESLSQQGLTASSLDLVVLPAGLSFSQTPQEDLERIRRLLAPGGLLVALEETGKPIWRNLLLQPFRSQKFHSDTQPETLSNRRLISRELLQGAGLGRVTRLEEEVSEPEKSLYLARNCGKREVPETPLSVASTLTPGESWLIFSDNSPLTDQIVKALRKRSQIPILVEAGTKFEAPDKDRFQIRPGEQDDIQAVVEAVAGTTKTCCGIIHLWSLLSPLKNSTTASSLEAAQTPCCISLLQLVQALEPVKWLDSPGVLVVSRGAHSVGNTVAESIAATPLWGFVRVLMNEHPNLRPRLLDLNPVPEVDEAEALIMEWERKDGEDEVAFRSGVRYVHRLAHLSIASQARNRPEYDPDCHNHRVIAEIGTPGILDSLRFASGPRQSPGPGQVEIEVGASALNFKDVAKAMGLLDDMTLEGTASGRSLGLECAGKITAVGEDVDRFRVGDQVVGFAAGTLGTHALADARLIGHRPAHLTEEDAATLMTVSMTAHYALNHLARIAIGERVLIHAGSGGVGLAAIQLAQKAGAEVFATAGNPEKRSFLRSLGISHVMDSRSILFSDQILELTGRKGVDVVLNSLSGETLARSLAILAPFGRFIEIGKRDIEENNRLGLRPFQNNLSFFAADLDRISLQRPDLAATLCREVLELVADGSLSPLPYRVFPATRLVEAFRYMATARHIGKIVISMEGIHSLASAPETRLELSPEATYLITGGLSGFGLATARWLTNCGARHLVLMGRSGASTNEARKEISALVQDGIEVVVETSDVTDEDQVRSVLDRMRESMPPLRGVIHSAMVLDDATVLQLSPKNLNTVLAPKVAGAWNLHTQTLSDQLTFFVMYSSFSSLFGNPGQSNYAAANAFLDALAHWRRNLNLPALTVNWGAIADVGVVARSSDLQLHFSRLGIEPLQTTRALEILGQLLQGGVVQAGVSPPLTWDRLSQFLPSVNSPRFSPLAGPSERTTEEQSNSIRDLLLNAQPERRQEILESHLRETLAAVIGTSPAKVDVDQPLLDLGLDSLMAVELITRIRGSLGIEIPAIKVVEGINLGALSIYLIGQLSDAEPGVQIRRVPNVRASDHTWVAETTGTGKRDPDIAGDPAGHKKNPSSP